MLRQVPRISVLIPFFNDGETLPAALASVREQEDCEIIVVDDGSDDSPSMALLEEVAESGVIVIHQANEGPFSARRAALAVSSAPYVFALDADDLVAPGALRTLGDALDEHPAAAAAWGDVKTFGDASVFQRGPRTLDPWLMTYMNELTGASTLIRREQLLETGWQIAGFENWDLWLSFCERGWQGVYIPGVVLHYRLHGNGTRRSAHLRRQFPALYSELQTRHARLFARRPILRSASPAPRRLKLALPIIDMLPLDAYVKHQIGNLIHHPVRPLAVRRDRLRQRFSQQP
jgi:glycosyltransferase involved in cell wall biosynthesis